MPAAIRVGDYEKHLEGYTERRVNTFNLQASSAAANRRDLTLFGRFLRERNARFITPELLLDFLGWLRQQRGNQPGTVNRKISSIRTYLNWLAFWQVRGAEQFPIDAIPRMHQPYCGPLKTLSPQEVRRLLDSVDRASVLGMRDYVLFSLLYGLGLRLGEALRLNLEDVDLERGLLQVRGKGRRERTLPLVNQLPALLRDWLWARHKLYRAEETDALFLSKKGNRLAARTVQENLQKLVAQAGPFSIAKVTAHSLRHAFATHSLEHSDDLVILKELLGHAKLQSTEIYVHPGLEQLRRVTNDHIASDIIREIMYDELYPLRIHQQRNKPAA